MSKTTDELRSEATQDAHAVSDTSPNVDTDTVGSAVPAVDFAALARQQGKQTGSDGPDISHSVDTAAAVSDDTYAITDDPQDKTARSKPNRAAAWRSGGNKAPASVQRVAHPPTTTPEVPEPPTASQQTPTRRPTRPTKIDRFAYMPAPAPAAPAAKRPAVADRPIRPAQSLEGKAVIIVSPRLDRDHTMNNSAHAAVGHAQTAARLGAHVLRVVPASPTSTEMEIVEVDPLNVHDAGPAHAAEVPLAGRTLDRWSILPSVEVIIVQFPGPLTTAAQMETLFTRADGTHPTLVADVSHASVLHGEVYASEGGVRTRLQDLADEVAGFDVVRVASEKVMTALQPLLRQRGSKAEVVMTRLQGTGLLTHPPTTPGLTDEANLEAWGIPKGEAHAIVADAAERTRDADRAAWEAARQQGQQADRHQFERAQLQRDSL